MQTTPFKTAHSVAVDAIAVVVDHKPVQRSWPFKVTVFNFVEESLDTANGAATLAAPVSGGRGTSTAETGAALSAVPCGNYGDNLTTGNRGCL